MKHRHAILILALTGYAFAQAPGNKPPAPKPTSTAAPSKPAQTTPAKPAGTTAGKPQTTQASVPAPKPATAAKPVTGKRPKTAVAKKATPSKPLKEAAKKETPAKAAPAPEKDKKETDAMLATKGHRDPFLSVIMNREGPPCAGGGKKCIAIDQVTLQGVVRSPGGPIAVISSGANKTYFLRENDPVYNGVVIKISPDSIIFRETVMDRLGKTSEREVVKKIRPSV